MSEHAHIKAIIRHRKARKALIVAAAAIAASATLYAVPHTAARAARAELEKVNTSDLELVETWAGDCVVAYLAATAESHAALGRCADMEKVELPANKQTATDPKPMGHAWADAGDGAVQYYIKIGVLTHRPSSQDTDARACYGTQIVLEPAAVRLLKLPQPEQCSEKIGTTTPTTAPAYTATVSDGDDMYKRVQSFLQAYTTPKGDLDAYKDPSFKTKRLDPSPYTDFTLTSLVSAAPADDGTRRVLARGSGDLGVAGKRSVDYSLVMVYRGAWNVQSIDQTAPTK